MAYIGNIPTIGNFRKLDDISASFNGVTTQFEVAIDGDPARVTSARQCILSLNGVVQEAGVSFTVGTTDTSILFSEAPSAGDTFWCLIIGDALSIPGIADNTVTTAKLVNSAVTNQKVAVDAITATNIVNGAITDDKYAETSIATSKLKDSAVTLQKIQNNAVTSDKVTTGFVVNRAYAEYTANTNITSVIDYDDTIPLVSEGTEILSAAITPKSTTNRLRIRVQGMFGLSSTTNAIILGVFVNGGTNAIGATAKTGTSTTYPDEIVFECEYVPGTEAAQTISVRVGVAVAGTLRMNGTSAARRFGGVAKTTLIVEELKA